jgi:hypothetical protein
VCSFDSLLSQRGAEEVGPVKSTDPVGGSNMTLATGAGLVWGFVGGNSLSNPLIFKIVGGVKGVWGKKGNSPWKTFSFPLPEERSLDAIHTRRTTIYAARVGQLVFLAGNQKAFIPERAENAPPSDLRPVHVLA